MTITKTNHQWQRVQATYMDSDEKQRQNRNVSTMKNDVFLKACELAKVKVTERQSSRWNNKRGSAFTLKMEAISIIAKEKAEAAA